MVPMRASTPTMIAATMSTFMSYPKRLDRQTIHLASLASRTPLNCHLEPAGKKFL